MNDVLHPALPAHAAEVAAGRMDRREFLARATSLGASAAAAYGLLGLAAPAARAQEKREGGTLRIQQEVRALKDPRTYDWPQMSNTTRGTLEYLVQYEADGTFTPMLLESWEVSDDATEYTLNVRPGVTWHDGAPLTADDIAFNVARWSDSTVEGNAMSSRFGALIDEATGLLREGAVIVEDDTTLRLVLDTPDITLIASFSDYPAAIVAQDFTGDPLQAKGTGPYRIAQYDIGERAILEKIADRPWWGEGVFGPATLDVIEFRDFGTDQAAIFAAADSDEVDMTYESIGEFIELFDTLGWEKSETVTAGTICIRPNQIAEVDGTRPYEDVRVRRALQLAVDNQVLLDLGYVGRGAIGENHHVAQIHPEYADIGPAEYDPEEARRLMEEAGMMDFEHELISIDDDWRRPTCDAMAAQLRDAGFKVSRTILPGATFWNDWTKYPFSATDWGTRPLGVQTLALAYKSGVPWNESGFSNAEFDSLLTEAQAIVDADERRTIMERIETIMREEGVITQPYWRAIFRHHKNEVVGAEMHPVFEIHLHKLGLAA